MPGDSHTARHTEYECYDCGLSVQVSWADHGDVRDQPEVVCNGCGEQMEAQEQHAPEWRSV